MDSNADPFITQKDVILCRSGIQYYHKSELKAWMTEDSMPKVEKEWYAEYRPANVVVKAKKLCASLPVTREHPDMWVDSKNWKRLAGGTTDKEVEVVALDGESEGEIGLKSSLTFYDADLYDYYNSNNKEVSVGYTCRKHWVDNPEEVGYDLVLDEIMEVNHLAITKSGRGGSSVAVIDSLLGGIKPMRTGIFAWLAGKKQKDSAVSFGNSVLDSLKTSKGVTEEEIAGEMKGILDSCAVLKDCAEKETLINAVRDCFDHKELSLNHESELIEQFDSMFKAASEESLKGFNADSKEEDKVDDACSKDEEKSEEKVEETEDSVLESKERAACSDSDEKKDEEEKAEDSEVEEEKADEEEKSAKDSLMLDKEAVQAMIKDSLSDSLEAMVMDAVKKCLGIKDIHAPSVEGAELDSTTKERTVINRDYSDFLEG